VVTSQLNLEKPSTYFWFILIRLYTFGHKTNKCVDRTSRRFFLISEVYHYSFITTRTSRDSHRQKKAILLLAGPVLCNTSVRS
jgi:hypothetical protein